MTLADQMQADMARLISTDDFATTVTYITPNGIETELTAVLFGKRSEQMDKEGVNTIIHTQDCTWATSDLDSVNLKATIEAESLEWAIADIVYRDDYQTTVRLQRVTLHEQTRSRFRRQ